MTNPVVPKKGLLSVERIYKAKLRLKKVVVHTPLMYNHFLSEKYECDLSLKREDLQATRSYKIRGAFNKMSQTPRKQLDNGIVCASAGNHAQGVALACRELGVMGRIYMPETTPRQKIKKVKSFGKENIEIILEGDTFDDAFMKAKLDSETNDKIFIHPFDDEAIIEGQGTIGLEIIEDSEDPIDFIFVAIGGGGLAAGLCSYLKQISPSTKIIGIEPEGAPAMYRSLEKGKVESLTSIDNFVDGAAVKRVGQKTFEICKLALDDIILVPEGKVCTTILELYNEEAIVVEPAGALTIAALDTYRDQIKGKRVVCIVSGGNNDITRTEEIKERSLRYEGLKHYFVISFPQRAGALREFLNEVLGENDDITHFEYTKRNSRERGPAIVGVELKRRTDYEGLLQRMQTANIKFQTLNDNPMLFDLLV